MIKLKDKTIIFVLVKNSSTRVRVRNHWEQWNFCVCVQCMCVTLRSNTIFYIIFLSLLPKNYCPFSGKCFVCLDSIYFKKVLSMNSIRVSMKVPHSVYEFNQSIYESATYCLKVSPTAVLFMNYSSSSWIPQVICIPWLKLLPPGSSTWHQLE